MQRGEKRRVRKEIPEVGPALRTQVYIETHVSESVSVIRRNKCSMYRKCVIVALLAVVAMASARSTTTSQANAIPQEQAGRADDSSASFVSDLRFLHKMYQECASTDLSTCLKLKLVTAMDRAARAYPAVTLFDGITFVRDVEQPATGTPSSEAEIEASLPRSLTDREDALNTLIVDKIADFFSTHTLQVCKDRLIETCGWFAVSRDTVTILRQISLCTFVQQVKLPSAADLQRSFNGEERAKRKKMSGLLMIPLLLGGTLIPLFLGGLALLAGKALIVSKLALVLAAIIGLKKLLGGGGGHGHGHEEVVVASPGHGSSGWGRSYDKEQAQSLAYSAYAPKTTTR